MAFVKAFWEKNDGMAKVSIEPRGLILDQLRWKENKEYQLTGPKRVSELTVDLGLQTFLSGVIFVVNGEKAPAEHLLKDGDTVAVYPMVAGG